ncbi:3-isopropylmalate dehydratase large subunit [Desulfosporosinus sp. BICA1-9]|uniref:3-isopropylmalate dehydratase large subunit n=1 Tax=Desulfosporosinus sp. BICA1-9 TaxID=1531958 RepID=UPI00054B0D36|nr:3-isopropylmalate dehydratase large subunit [Desulfosporosinus sp. BICA1-9]KJS46477.1 MAG: 3-isopropylmalate dehydratase [Peptococcaceae bacterium BRH_c23]KJS87614.1 MAG: 3-isopropylmalate dehydratase [Desulfosporosinus sp. BICA1-9]
MGMTITEKILADHAGKAQVQPGELVNGKLDVVLANDITAPIAVSELKKMGYNQVYDNKRVMFVMDHFAPNANLKAAQQCKVCRDFARSSGLEHFYDVGNMGIEHALLPEQGLVVPGDVVIGGDSHTCTYGGLGAFATGVGSTDVAAGMALGQLWLKVPGSIKFVYRGKLPRFITGKDLILYTIGRIGVDGALYKAMEFTGEAISQLAMDGRFTMCNMAIEAGAKNGIVPPDEQTENYVKSRAKRPWRFWHSDADARYEAVFEYDVTDLEPQVAFPHLPSNSKNVSEGINVSIDQVIIGSCTNGRLEDLRLAAELLRGKKAHPYVRTVIIPATQEIYRQAMREGLIEIFIEAGAAVSTPTCGPCFGGHMGILAEGERCVSTTNRNFVGRMGHASSEVYLASPAVAAASAIKGRIASPWEVV